MLLHVLLQRAPGSRRVGTGDQSRGEREQEEQGPLMQSWNEEKHDAANRAGSSGIQSGIHFMICHSNSAIGPAPPVHGW